MKVLAVPPSSPTHLAAIVPLCWALRTAGHDVLVACQSDLVRPVRAAGLSAVEVGSAAPLDEEYRRHIHEQMFPLTAYGRRDQPMGQALWEQVGGAWSNLAIAQAAGYLALGRAWRPDLLLGDPAAVVGRVVGAALGIPTVSHRWGVDPTSGPFEVAARQALAPLCAELGLPGLPEPTLVIDPCPPSIQVEDAPPGLPVRYVPFNGTGTIPDWLLTRSTRRRVCVCMGASVLQLTGPRPVRRALAALAGVDDIEVIVALTAQNREVVGELPAGVRMVEALPLHLFLGTCDLLVGAGGSGTGLTAVACGVPQLVLPQWTDQFDFERRLTDAGAGFAIPDAADQADVDGIRSAINKLLDDPGYTESTQRLRAEIGATPSAHALVGVLEDLARTHRPARP